MRTWGAFAGAVAGVGFGILLVGAGAAAATVGIGLVWLATTWFMNLVLR